MDSENLSAPAPPIGVVESLTRGFETVAERLVLVLVPLALDLLLWIGPRVSFAPAIDRVVAGYHDDLWEPFVASMNPDLEGRWPELAEAITTALGGRATQYYPLALAPILLGGREAAPLPFDLVPPVWEIDGLLLMAGVRVLSLVAGLIVLSFYAGLIAQQVKQGSIDFKRLLRRLPAQVLWMAVLVVALPLILIVIYMPFALLAVGFAMFSAALAVIADWAGRLLALWIALFLVFTIPGLFMSNRSLPGAVWDSIRVVQWNTTPTLIMTVLSVAIYAALGYIWSLALAGPWLTPVAIVGHAFVVTALAAALFVFFKDRYRHWRELRAQLLVELERRRMQQG
jgi:hypothetical protein